MKKFAWTIINITLILLLLIAAATIIVDPFIHFHKPLGKWAAVETSERYALIGVAKNMDYDTALIGSSMSENFLASWFEDGTFGNSCVKLCLQGAHFDDFNIILNAVLQHDNTKTVLFCLDTYLLTNIPGEYPTTIPSYLSDDNLFNDIYYILNKDVVFEYIPKFILNNKWEHYSADSAYTWQDMFVFSKDSVISTYKKQRLTTTFEEKPYDLYLDNCDAFLSSMIPYIENNPDVTFYFYASPYSILFWDDSMRRGDTAAEITAYAYVCERLLTYKNVRMFYFQNATDIITNLDNYRDYSHFSQDINYFMFESMRDGKYELKEDTYYDTLLDMYHYAKSYDYESLFQ